MRNCAVPLESEPAAPQTHAKFFLITPPVSCPVLQLQSSSVQPLAISHRGTRDETSRQERQRRREINLEAAQGNEDDPVGMVVIGPWPWLPNTPIASSGLGHAVVRRFRLGRSSHHLLSLILASSIQITPCNTVCDGFLVCGVHVVGTEDGDMFDYPPEYLRLLFHDLMLSTTMSCSLRIGR
ncbi:hypothetical protein BU24DRAFT_56032 [Aaosphaeria arxii CBS 175.79]|uniref:Uncharacterized protein n=1 Tax=Aaosphaeria arxii CBS 175.79 TaxID=1450172 RepID=A0A6A5XBI3_9PLEO|nr:uncharacterized protein BU24DRAFT_56032 [Aaosphaeria arxii CBS 175.79]KAF2010322.1 hypothetical protein BU24DRAFT_56032 [Aaosphaeria arxii CBS 175.79]